MAPFLWKADSPQVATDLNPVRARTEGGRAKLTVNQRSRREGQNQEIPHPGPTLALEFCIKNTC